MTTISSVRSYDNNVHRSSMIASYPQVIQDLCEDIKHSMYTDVSAHDTPNKSLAHIGICSRCWHGTQSLGKGSNLIQSHAVRVGRQRFQPRFASGNTPARYWHRLFGSAEQRCSCPRDGGKPWSVELVFSASRDDKMRRHGVRLKESSFQCNSGLGKGPNRWVDEDYQWLLPIGTSLPRQSCRDDGEERVSFQT